MDIKLAIKYAQLVNAAYAVSPTALGNSAGQQIGAGGTTYTVVSTVYANDLATSIDPLRSTQLVSIGFILQATDADEVVIAIRGTEGILEWIQDARFSLVACPFLKAAGNTEDGFTAMYTSFRTGVDPAAPTVVGALAAAASTGSATTGSAATGPAAVVFPRPLSSATAITICGHSLGASLATLLALDVAANTSFTNPTAYTYASPRTGDSNFVSLYNHLVPNTFRIANRVDIVPKLPTPPLYDHVLGLYELNPIQWTPLPPKVLVKPDIACEHILTTYLYLLSLQSGGAVLPLEARCIPGALGL